MALILSIADYVVIILMMGISAGIGVYFRFTGGKQKTTLEFLMADKSMSILPVTFSMMATSFSAVSLLGVPAETYLYGTQMLIKELSYPIGVAIVAYYILPIYFEIEENSIYEYLGKRFGKLIKIITSILFSIQMLLYMPFVIYAPSLALSTFTGLSVWTSVISMAFVCTFYSTLGGLKAVLWTDLFQSILMILTIYSLIFQGSIDYGGFYKVFETALKGQRIEFFNTSLDFTVRYTFWNTFIQGLVLNMVWCGTTFVTVQRLMSTGCLKKARKGLLWSVPLCFLFQLGACILGITMYSYFSDCDPIKNNEIKSADQLVLLFILKLFGHLPGLPGLCVAGIFSAALSTMSSVINSLAAITLEDYIKPFIKCKKFDEAKNSILVKILALFYGVLCLILTFVFANAKGLFQSSVVLVGMVGGPTLGVFFLGMFTTSGNELGAALGLIAGFAMGAWHGFGSLFNPLKYPTLPLTSAGCFLNASTLLDEMTNGNSTNFPHPGTIEDERYIFPLYKMSFVWAITVGFLITLVVGYLASCIIAFWKPKREIDPHLLSPAVRKWLTKSSTIQNEKKSCIVLQVLN